MAKKRQRPRRCQPEPEIFDLRGRCRQLEKPIRRVGRNLTHMGKTLQAQQFSFRSHTYRVYAGPNGELLHIAHSTKTVVRRPDHLRVDIIGDDVNIKMVYDGKTLAVFNPDQKIYAIIPVTGSIDKMLDYAETRLGGVDFVLSDFLSDDPAKAVLSDLTYGGQVGAAIIDGVRCQHFFFNQEPDIDVEPEIWPRRSTTSAYRCPCS